MASDVIWGCRRPWTPPYDVVAGSGPEVGASLTTHPRVRKVSFTGSTATGRAIMRDASVNLKNLSLEL